MYGDHMPPFEQNSMTFGQSMVGIEDGGTDGFELGAGGVGDIDIEGADEGSFSVGKKLFDGISDGWLEGLLLGWLDG